MGILPDPDVILPDPDVILPFRDFGADKMSTPQESSLDCATRVSSQKM
jgi:hypothetical protein